MDQTRVDFIRKSMEAQSTEELRHAYESGAQGGRLPEELEAMRQILDERRRKFFRFWLAVGSAVVAGALGGAGTWWQVGEPNLFVILATVVCAFLGFAAWYRWY